MSVFMNHYLLKSLLKSKLGLFAFPLFIYLMSCQSIEETQTPSGDTTNQAVYLYVASSLESLVGEINQQYKLRYPSRQIFTSLLGSQTARMQIEHGAPSGIFISAAKSHINILEKQHKIGEWQKFATTNILLLAQKGTTVKKFQELNLARKIGIGTKKVPIGHYAWSLLHAFGQQHPQWFKQVTLNILTQELSARALKGRFKRKEVDYAFLYEHDYLPLEGSQIISLPKELIPLSKVTFYIATTIHKTNISPSSAVQDWFHLSMSSQGKMIQQKYGLRR